MSEPASGIIFCGLQPQRKFQNFKKSKNGKNENRPLEPPQGGRGGSHGRTDIPWGSYK